MDNDLILHVGQQALKTALLMSAPVLGIALIVGLLVALLQAVTSVRDMTLGLVVKIVTVGLTLMICGAWMMNLAVSFTYSVFNQMQSLVR